MTSCLYWWPKLQDVFKRERINVPKTRVYEIDSEDFIEGEEGPYLPREILQDYADKIASDNQKYPIFIKTDTYSGKHGYKYSCFVPDKDSLMKHLNHLADEHYYTFDEVPRAFMVREYLKLHSAFTAFEGLPIAKEVRFGAENGNVFKTIPYWPKDAIRFYGEEDVPDWEVKLENLNAIEVPDHVLKWAEAISLELPGAWSLDFALDEKGNWWFIDCAVWERSWKGD